MAEAEIPHAPIDETSRARLAEGGLTLRAVDLEDAPAFDEWCQAINRGFHDTEATKEELDDVREHRQSMRACGVFDETIAHPESPVATVGAWSMRLAIPGATVPMWAVSEVTVAPTHRRRGIARALLESEVRSARDAGYAVAGLTVSEATLYGRYGFGPAAPSGSFEIQARRAGWRGGESAGRIEFITKNEAATDLERVHLASFEQRIGDVSGWTARWRRIAGLGPGDEGKAKRAVRYLDEHGEIRGVMVYTVKHGDDFTSATLTIHQLIAATDQATRELYRFALAQDLVATVKADVRPVDDIVRWVIADERAATERVRDHGWIRIIDIERLFGARSYAADADVTIAVTDPLDIAGGTFRITATNGRASVVRVDDAEADLVVGIADLSAAFLGALPLVALLASGRIAGSREAAFALDTALKTERAPHLSIWY